MLTFMGVDFLGRQTEEASLSAADHRELLKHVLQASTLCPRMDVAQFVYMNGLEGLQVM